MVRVTLKLTYEVAVVTASFRRLPQSIAIGNSTSWLCLSHPKIFNLNFCIVNCMSQIIVSHEKNLFPFHFTTNIMDQVRITANSHPNRHPAVWTNPFVKRGFAFWLWFVFVNKIVTPIIFIDFRYVVCSFRRKYSVFSQKYINRGALICRLSMHPCWSFRI